MHGLHYSVTAALLFVLVGPADRLRAETPADPLRLLPAQANVVIQVPKPRQLVEAYTTYDLVKQLQVLEPVKEFADSTNMRRFNQLVAYFEKRLGTGYADALDRVAGGGIALGVKIGTDPAPALLVIQGTDAALVRKFADIGMGVLEQELIRGESKDRLRKEKYRDVETYYIGKDFNAAVAGSAILLSNKEDVLKKALDLHHDGPTQSLAALPEPREARKLLPAEPLAWIWLNLDAAHKSPQGKEIFALPRNDANLTVLFGGLLDVLGRSPYVCAALTREKNDLLFTVRMPRGHEGMPEGLSMHAPPSGKPGTLPPLQPKSTLFSTSYYFDLAAVWEQRARLFNAKQVKQFEDFDKQSAFFLLGNRFSKLAAQVGPHHRVVVVNQPRVPYAKQPDQHIPAFALVTSLREPEKFGRAITPILRGAGLLASTQVKLKLVEEMHGDVAIVGYRFPEDNSIKDDEGYLRYNYSPAFARVGDQFIFSSTLELAKELVDLLKEEQKHNAGQAALNGQEIETELQKLAVSLAATNDAEARGKLIDRLHVLEQHRRKLAAMTKAPAGTATKERSRFYSAGAVDALLVNEEELIAQTILNQNLTPEAAKKQVGVFIDLIRRIDFIESETRYGPKEYRIDLRLVMKMQ